VTPLDDERDTGWTLARLVACGIAGFLVGLAVCWLAH
jgi:hypothetical protein